jgi:hypothetical protein
VGRVRTTRPDFGSVEDAVTVEEYGGTPHPRPTARSSSIAVMD